MRQQFIKHLGWLVAAGLLTSTSVASAAEAWVEVAVSSTGERYLVDQNSIRRTDNQVQYWEYRELPQTRALLADQSGQPSQLVYGMMLYRSVNCVAQRGELLRLVLFNPERRVIRRVNYEATGGLSQSIVGSPALTVLQYVCEQ